MQFPFIFVLFNIFYIHTYVAVTHTLQSVDIMKAIITFYTKAKAFVQLAGFYDGCAQVRSIYEFPHVYKHTYIHTYIHTRWRSMSTATTRRQSVL